MFKHNNIYFISFVSLIILILFTKEIIGDILNAYDVSTLNANNENGEIYSRYPSTSDYNFCEFKFDILVTKQSTYSIRFQPLSDVGFSSDEISNLTSSLRSFSLVNIPFGQHTFSVFINYSIAVNFPAPPDTNTTIFIDHECKKFEKDSISFSYYPMYIERRSPYTPQGMLKMNGFNHNININANLVSLYDLGFNIYSVFIYSISGPLTSNFNLTVKFYDFTIDILIPTIYNTNYQSNLSNIKLYPNEKNITFPGLKTYPVYSFETHFSSFNDYPYFYIFDGISLVTPSIIYGTNDTYTYMGYIDLLTFSKNSLYSQNLKKFGPVYNISMELSNILKPSLLPSTGIISNIEIIQPNYKTFDFSFNGTSIYDFNSFEYSYKFLLVPYEYSWPFGFESGCNTNYNFKISVLSLLLFGQPKASLSINPKNTYTYLTIEVECELINASLSVYRLVDFKSSYLYDFKHLVEIKISDVINPNDSFFKLTALSTKGVIREYKSYKTENNNLYLEFVVDSIETLSDFSVYSTPSYTSQLFSSSVFYSINPPKRFSITKYPLFDVFTIYNISFLYNNIDFIENENFANILYYNIKNMDISRVDQYIVSFQLNDPVSYDINAESKKYYSKWNDQLKMFQIEFFLPKNNLNGIVPFTLLTSDSTFLSSSLLPISSQLYIYSKYFDAYGPIISNISKISRNNDSVFGWEFYIEDNINGFENGEIIVRGEIDSSTYKFILSLKDLIVGDKFRGKYEITINLISKFCITQRYIITDVKLYDSGHNLGFYSMMDYNFFNSIRNPFINYYSDFKNISSNQKDCGNFIDKTGPLLKSFNAFSYSVNTISFTFEAEDKDSGLKYNQYPIVYISANDIETVECKSNIAFIDEKNAGYNCTIELSPEFGSSNTDYGNKLIFSVYGFINNGGYYSGFPSSQLKSLGYYYQFENFKIYPKLKITNSSSITTAGGDLWLFGRKFTTTNNGSFIVKVVYSDMFIVDQMLVPTIVYETVLKISGIKSTKYPFTVQIILAQNVSNVYTINPTLFFYDYSPTPLPTNAPQKCAGNPECGGPNNGYCSQISGCVCYSPWIGLECNSRIVIIPQPSINASNPSTEIPITDGGNDNNNNENSTTILFRSLISMVSLRELDYNSNIENEYKFEKWIYTKKNKEEHQYFTSIQVVAPSSSSGGIITTTTTNITATLQWFANETTINFGKQELKMNPSTIKYTIEIGKYNFRSQLNQLQLVLSATLNSNTTRYCSKSEFGETSSGDNSNYIKLQVGDHSLFGRFIKRAVLDSTVRGVNNVLLDSNMNPIKSSSTSQSYIGIMVPYYNENAIIDPDFSVLVDSKPASSDDSNSICIPTPSTSSSITKSQLAGIIVVSVVVFISLSIIIVFLIIKKRKHTLLLLMAKDIMLNKKR